MVKNKLYRLRITKQYGKYQVMFHHIPSKWFSTGTDNLEEAIIWAEDKLRKDLKSGYDYERLNITLNEFCRDMFSEKDPYGIRQREAKYNHIYSDYYFTQKTALMNNYILEHFGNYKVMAISDTAIEDWFLDVKGKNGSVLADDTKNKILATFRIILREAKRQGLVSENVADNVRMITVRAQKRQPFSPEEMALLFPKDDEKLVKIWQTEFWACYFLILRDTGFRPGEIAGLSTDSFFFDLHGVFTKRSVDFKTRTLQDSIKTTKNGKDYKVGLLTAQTERLLKKRIALCKEKKEDYLFLIDGKFIEPCTSNKHFKSCAEKMVELKERTQYCLRHSFETDLAGRIENKVLAELMAHTKFNPVYDHRTPETILKELQPVRDLLEKR